jgi:hypothetical protein
MVAIRSSFTTLNDLVATRSPNDKKKKKKYNNNNNNMVATRSSLAI